jgi:prepilin signal peptidase PulO-like enzyme (type II secretory pathway)
MIFFGIIFGFCFGHVAKRIINWIKIDSFALGTKNISLELLSILISVWSFLNLDLMQAIPFGLLCITLFAISFVDYKTYQIPLIFILIGIFLASVNIALGNIFLTAALWGVFIGSLIPLFILGVMWFITKRQGMGFGDIQLGIVLGAMLGPMRMALTLFFAPLLSLLSWLVVSIFKGFNRDRAMPMAPFFTIAATLVYIGSFYYPDFFYFLIMR